MKSGRHYSDTDIDAIQRDLEDQFNEIRDENSILKERVRKLRIIHKGLSAKRDASKRKKPTKIGPAY